MPTILDKFLLVCCLLFSLATLNGCATLDEYIGSGSSTKDEDYVGWNAEKFRTEAKSAVESGNYDKASKIYEALEARYPFDVAAHQTLLDSAYAYYKNSDPEAALAAADRFIKTYPREPHIDYAYYLKGLINYNRDFSFIDRFLPSDPSQRDQVYANDALENFAELMRRFPKSQYVADAQLRSVALRNTLSMHEIHVARYYIKREAYIAAVNRAKNVIEKYPRSTAIPYALDILKDAYTKLNMPQLASDAKRIYAQNYPNGTPSQEEADLTVSQELWNLIGFDK